MPLIDDQGRLFGKINVIDGAVLSLLAVFAVTAGAFLVDGEQTRNVHAQVAMQDVPREASQALNPGTELHGGAVTVTEVRHVQATSTTDRVFARLNVTTTLDDDTGRHRLGQTVVQRGANLPLSVAGHELQASISLVDEEQGFTYLQPPTEVLFVDREVERPVAQLPDEGLVSLGAENVLDVNGSAVVPRSPTTADVFVWGATYRLGGNADPGQPALLPGASTILTAPGLRLDGELRNPDEDGRPVEPASTSLTVLAGSTDGSRPQARVGNQIRLSEDVHATVTDVLPLDGPVVNDPSTVLPLDGPVVNDPSTDAIESRPRLLVAFDVAASSVNDRLEFRGESLEVGQTFRFDAGGSSLEGPIREIGDRGGDGGSTNVTLQASRVPPWAADHLDPGDRETTRAGETLATIRALERRPSTMIVTHEGQVHEREHPRLLDLTLRVQLHTDSSGWKDAEIAPGQELYLRPDGIPLAATVHEVT
jgi:hypothetical protein